MPRPVIAPMLAVLAALVLAACANPRAEQAAYARQALIGMPEQTLLSCAGVPDRSLASGGRDYFTYEVQTIETYGSGYRRGYGSAFAFLSSSRGHRHHHRRRHFPFYSLGFGIPVAPSIRSNSCEATFILEDGRVAQVSYNTSPGGSLAQCYGIVQNCMVYAPPAPAL